MRIKLQTEPPLPPLKAWLNIHSESTILQLKHSIRTKIEVIHNVVTSSSDLVLILDDFQLLDNIEIDVIRDGDCVSCVHSFPTFFLLSLSSYSIRKLNGPPKQVTPFSNGVFSNSHICVLDWPYAPPDRTWTTEGHRDLFVLRLELNPRFRIRIRIRI